MHLLDASFMIQRGSLVIAQGYRGARLTLLSVIGVRDAIVSVSPLPCTRSRRVHFADEQRDTSLVVHAQSEDRHVEQESSMDARLEQSSVVVTDTYALHAEQSIDMVVHDTPMLDRQVERSCSSETRQEIVVEESMHGEIKQVSSSGDAQ